jgi:hypothetical protein
MAMKSLLITLLVGISICQAQTIPDTTHIPKTSLPYFLYINDNRSLSSNKPLVLVKGKELTEPYRLNPDSIRSIEVIGPGDPRRQAYGLKGQHGVILVELKPGREVLSRPYKK